MAPSPVEQMEFRGGDLDGARIELPTHIAEDVVTEKAIITITPAGRVYNRTTGQYVHRGQVIELPKAMR